MSHDVTTYRVGFSLQRRLLVARRLHARESKDFGRRVTQRIVNDFSMDHGSVVIRLVFKTVAYSASESFEVES
jgi:hypothetical protein